MSFSPTDVLHGDFETYSACDLKKAGGYRYAMHPSTEALCFAWAINESAVYIWVPCITELEADLNGFPSAEDGWFYGPEVPKLLREAIEAGVRFLAHNASFERAVWENVVVKYHKGPRTKRSQYGCTAVRAAAAHLPRGLDGAAMALETQNQKDADGKRLLKKFSVPRKPTKKDLRTRIMPMDEPEEFRALCWYCIGDVKAERDIDKLLPELHPNEQKLFTFDMQINERGLLIDIESVRNAAYVLASLEANIVADVMQRTKCEQYPDGLRPTQGVKMLQFFRDMGAELENLQADHVRKFVKENISSLPQLVKELLLLRIEAGKSSTKKFISMEACAGDGDNRARGTLLMFGAHTGRWSGRLIQPQNFSRGTLKYEEVLRVFELLKHRDHELMSMLYEWPITAIGSTMRGYLIPTPGKIFRVVDYASIEARVLAWLAQEFGVLEVYRSGKNLYKVMAAQVFGLQDADSLDKASNEYKIGKNLILGCIQKGTLVLSNRGLVPIESITLNDKLWDGVEWVEHEGLIAKGEKWVIEYDGIWLTPDHEILTPEGWRPAAMLAIREAFDNWKFAETFDIANAGPNHRFTVSGTRGDVVVHNCGYGLGGAKFVAYSEKAGVEITEAFAKEAVRSYRENHKKIVQFWADVERCAISAVQNKATEQRPVVLRNLAFYNDGRWLCIRLPSGRSLRYYRPKVVPVEKFGKPGLQLQFKTEFRGRMLSESTYGGKLVENITQAVARDLLVNGMFQAEAHGYPVFGTVHDEIITEQDVNAGSIHELEKIVCILPEWAYGLPVEAEGFESYRYRK